MGWLLMLLCLSTDNSQLPRLAEMFSDCQMQALAEALPRETRVQLDLRPVLNDAGTLSRDQVLMSFTKICDRFRVVEATITNTQSDTNYAWLEVYLDLTLEERATDLTYHVTFAFHYKIIGAKVAISRWVLQDIR